MWNRREFLHRTWATSISLVLASPGFAVAQPARASGLPFSIEQLRERARQRAERPFRPPADTLPSALEDLTYDQYRDIRYRPAAALWPEDPFSVQFFHRGFYYKTPIRIFEVVAGHAQPVTYRADLFDYGANPFDASRFGPEFGFAGFRIHHRLNHPDVLDELIAFLGASYFRALGRGLRYGVSARGLAIGTASEAGEEFPFFSEFYLEVPVDANSLVIHALLDSQSLTGAYTFTVRPGTDTIVDVVMSLYTRNSIDAVGIAPLTSMFFFGPNDRLDIDDFRPEVHDSDGLMIWTGNGEWLWRPLVNPRRLRISAFADRNPRGFGLLQRNRDFAAYQDLESRYEARPSLWIEPVGDWGTGSVMLVEIPTNEEINDNIVAFWRPASPIDAHSEWHGAYRLHWCADVSFVTRRLGAALATRVGRGTTEGSRLFVIDFGGGSLPTVAGVPLKAQITTSRGELRNAVTHFNDMHTTWRVTFELLPAGDDPIELRCLLTDGTRNLSETWCYQWTAG